MSTLKKRPAAKSKAPYKFRGLDAVVKHLSPIVRRARPRKLSAKHIRALEWANQPNVEAQAIAGLRAAQWLAHKTATDAGWYRNPKTGRKIKRNFGEVVALMHSELSEALEADRKNLMDRHLPSRKGIEVEFADCIIRILDTAAALGLDVPGALIAKNRFNQSRADHKLKARRAGGKRY